MCYTQKTYDDCILCKCKNVANMSDKQTTSIPYSLFGENAKFNTHSLFSPLYDDVKHQKAIELNP